MSVDPENEGVAQRSDGNDEAAARRRLVGDGTSIFEKRFERYAPMLRRFADERHPARLARYTNEFQRLWGETVG